jgi:hypothetical protein
VTVVYGYQLPLLEWEREHHILVGAPASLLGVGCHRHVQLGVSCTDLVVLCAMRWVLEDRVECQPRRLRVPPTDLDVAALLGG